MENYKNILINLKNEILKKYYKMTKIVADFVK